MGDEELASEILQGFLDDMPSQITQLKRAVVDADIEGALRASHTIKGAAGNTGALALENAAALIEEAASIGDLRTASSILPSIEENLTKLTGRLAVCWPSIFADNGGNI